MKRTKKHKDSVCTPLNNKIRGAYPASNDLSRGTILTNDPSFTAWGWAVVSYTGNVLATGCIKTEPSNRKLKVRKGDDRVRRTSEISNVLIDLIKTYNVKYVLSELPHGSQNASAAVMLGIVVGILQAIVLCFDIGIEWYSEQDAKKFITGKRTATKDEMKALIANRYDVKWANVKYKDEAVADALAIYHVALSQSGTLKFLKNG